jgi:hypothetical protein
MKLYHIQHYESGTPHAYFTRNTGNQPVSSGGLGQYGNMIKFYAENRCQNNYYCHPITNWYLGSVSWAYAPGGIYDGNWHSIELRIRRNSSIGAIDGIIELWLDGVKKNYVDGYRGNDIPYNDSGSTELRGWRYVMIGGNTSNQFDSSCSNMADCEQWYAMDDVVVSTRYIGPGDAPTLPPPPPPNEEPDPPTGLTVIDVGQ